MSRKQREGKSPEAAGAFRVTISRKTKKRKKKRKRSLSIPDLVSSSSSSSSESDSDLDAEPWSYHPPDWAKEELVAFRRCRPKPCRLHSYKGGEEYHLLTRKEDGNWGLAGVLESLQATTVRTRTPPQAMQYGMVMRRLKMVARKAPGAKAPPSG